ncbi:MAG: hypothetical protein RLZZ502_1141 [Pseudomonadota bacterium]|jgi:succinate-semialdehyde dehydrogenase/glutarate-semialdehyde dehydrogenase
MITSINPSTASAIFEYALHTPEQLEQKLSKASQTQKAWAQQDLQSRASKLKKVSAVLREKKPYYATLITQEMGKPIAEAEAEIEKCAWNCDFYADMATTYLGDETVESNASVSKVVYEPLGLVLAIMPWNYPFWQVLRFAAPALAAGNGIVLKHANNVPQCALAIEELFLLAGLPEGLVATVLVAHSAVPQLIEDPRTSALTLTGSTPVGKMVAAQAGAVLKKQVLELGGADAFIVLADADLTLATKTAVKARFQNTGQSCIAAKRFIVVDSIAEAFVHEFCAQVAKLTVGDPMLRTTEQGPMARENLRAELHTQVQKTVAQGAKLLMGGEPLPGAGYFYAPTVLDGVTSAMVAGHEELFGPVAVIMRVADAEAAIALANSLDYGLGAAIWSKDVAQAERYARRIEAGAVFVNGLVASDPRYPFGGIKQSGYGRELGVHGAREFTNIKTVWIGPARQV